MHYTQILSQITLPTEKLFKDPVKKKRHESQLL